MPDKSMGEFIYETSDHSLEVKYDLSEVIKAAEDKVMKFSDPPVYERINRMDELGEITVDFSYSSPDGVRSVGLVGTTHNHDLTEDQIDKQKKHLDSRFDEYLKKKREGGGKPILMIEGGKVKEYASIEEVEQAQDEFAHLVWRAKQEGVEVYSPDTTPEDTTELMAQANYPQETIVFLECFKTLHVKTRG